MELSGSAFDDLFGRARKCDNLKTSKVTGYSLFLQLHWSSKTHEEKANETAALIKNMTLGGDMVLTLDKIQFGTICQKIINMCTPVLPLF